MKLALAMIVRTESEWLQRTLPCHSRDFSYRFAVDTGSTDDTLDVLRDFGFAVHSHPWERDYAKARNQCLDHCRKAGMTHVLMLDADEALLPDQVELATMVLDDDSKAYGLPRMNLYGNWRNPDWRYSTWPDYQPRLFALDRFLYTYPLHEWLVDRSTKTPASLVELHLPVIYHYGDCKPIKKRWLIHHNYNLQQRGEPSLDQLPEDLAALTDQEFSVHVNYHQSGEPFKAQHPLQIL